MDVSAAGGHDRSAELARVLREMETFNKSVSHDLRSPIGAILNFCAVLEEDYGSRLDPEGRRLLDRIRGAAGRANHLLDSLAEYSATDAGPRNVRQLDMNDLADRAFAEALGRDPSPGVQFIRENLPAAMGDPDLVERALISLFGSALRFSRNDTPRLIRVGASPGDGEIVYRVAGSGAADSEPRTELSEAFRRVHGHDVEGAGLGLAIASKIVGRLGGRVWGESDGARATLYFTLPSPSIP